MPPKSPDETAADSPDDQSLVRLLRRLTVETDRFVEVFGEAHGLHRTDLNALATVMDAGNRGETMSPSKLAEALHLSRSATTASLDRLEASGHLRRDRDAADRRRVGLEMPDKARELGREFFVPLAALYQQRWDEFGPAERRAIARFLTVSIEATAQARADLAE